MISPPKASFQTPHWNVSEVYEVLVGDGILDITLCVVIINALDMVKCRILLPDVTCMFSVKLSRQQPVTGESVDGSTQILWPLAKLGSILIAIPSFR